MADLETVHDTFDHTGLTGVGAGGGYDEGTSFPGGPSTGDKFFHNTYDLLFFYDGTRWLCTCPHVVPIGAGGEIAATTVTGRVAPDGTNDLWLEKCVWTTQVLTTNNGSANWTGQLLKIAITAGSSTELENHSTSADTANLAYIAEDTIGAVLDVSAEGLLAVLWTKNTTPGNLRANCTVHYRIIGV